jgi:uncharacterized protein YndB with AHSA1/START domain
MTKQNTLDLPHDIYNVRKSIYIVAPIQKVFDTITDSKHWDRFFTTGMELDPRPGGACNFKWKNFGPDLYSLESPGQVVEIEPPRRFVFEWGRPGERTLAQFNLETRGEGTVLSLFEDGYQKTPEGLKSILECSAHWGEVLALIKFYIEAGVTYRSPVVGGKVARAD